MVGIIGSLPALFEANDADRLACLLVKADNPSEVTQAAVREVLSELSEAAASTAALDQFFRSEIFTDILIAWTAMFPDVASIWNAALELCIATNNNRPRRNCNTEHHAQAHLAIEAIRTRGLALEGHGTRKVLRESTETCSLALEFLGRQTVCPRCADVITGDSASWDSVLKLCASSIRTNPDLAAKSMACISVAWEFATVAWIPVRETELACTILESRASTVQGLCHALGFVASVLGRNGAKAVDCIPETIGDSVADALQRDGSSRILKAQAALALEMLSSHGLIEKPWSRWAEVHAELDWAGYVPSIVLLLEPELSGTVQPIRKPAKKRPRGGTIAHSCREIPVDAEAQPRTKAARGDSPEVRDSLSLVSDSSDASPADDGVESIDQNPPLHGEAPSPNGTNPKKRKKAAKRKAAPRKAVTPVPGANLKKRKGASKRKGVPRKLVVQVTAEPGDLVVIDSD